MKCKNCGTHNNSRALKCIGCNAPLDGSMVVEGSVLGNQAAGYITCKNCKTSNTSDALKCISCNAPLEGSMVLENTPVKLPGRVVCKNCKTTNAADALKCLNCNAPLDGSMVLQRDTPKPGADEKKTDSKISTTAFYQNNVGVIVCPTCSYPNQMIAGTCVQCHTPLENKVKPGDGIILTGHEEAPARDPMSVTINPWAEQPGQPESYRLIPMKSDLTESDGGLKLDNTEAILNRNNLDPGNKTITSSSQAVISSKDGRWYIKNTSSMQTTFIRVNGEQEIQDGDILLMGNKMFKFSKES